MAFKMKSGNSPLFKDMGSREKEGPLYIKEDSPLQFFDMIKNSWDAAKGHMRALRKGEKPGDLENQEDCDCGENPSSGEENTMIGRAKEKAKALFGGEHWKKIKEDESKPG